MRQKRFKARCVIFIFDLLGAIAGIKIILKLAAVVDLIEGVCTFRVRIVVAFNVAATFVISVEARSFRGRAGARTTPGRAQPSAGAGAGFVFRAEDRNNNGSANDLGDVSVFVDPTLVGGSFPPNYVTGLAVAEVDVNGNGLISDDERFVYVAVPNGPKPSTGYVANGDLCVWRYHDGNGNGTATDTGEAELISVHPTGAFNRGLDLAPSLLDGGMQQTFYSRSMLVTAKTGGCVTTLGTVVELDAKRDKVEQGTQGTPFGGNAAFAITTRGNGPASLAAVAIGVGIAPAPFVLEHCDLWLLPPLFVDTIAPVLADANGVAVHAKCLIDEKPL